MIKDKVVATRNRFTTGTNVVVIVVDVHICILVVHVDTIGSVDEVRP
jgi:hypothetical protein